MGRAFDLTPVEVPKVQTKYRKIVTKLPAPESLPILERLRKYEPVSMSGQPPVVWDHAEGINVFDKWGNMWLDWSSGVLVTNAGHSNPKIVDAIVKQAQHKLLHNYCFPSEIRSLLAEKLVEISDPAFDKVFLLTTGSEATENAIKLARTYGISVGGEEEDQDHLLRARLPRPDARRPACRRHPRPQEVDRQHRPHLRAGRVPGRLPLRGHEFRILPQAA